MKQLLPFFLIAILSSCGPANVFSGLPQPDQQATSLAKALGKQPGDSALKSRFVDAFQYASAAHLNTIERLQASNQPDKWDRILTQYQQLQQLNDVVFKYQLPTNLVKPIDYRADYAAAQEKAAEAKYARAQQLLAGGTRAAAMQAAGLLREVNQMVPGYRNTDQLLQQAADMSVLDIVINPVNYFNYSYDYYGLRNDFVQQQFLNDLRYQLSTDRNVRVHSRQEAFANKVFADRVVDLAWDELYIPLPTQNTFTRDVSKQVLKGHAADGKPVYETVYATIIVTRRFIQARGTLSCRIYEPGTNRNLLFRNFPGGYTWRDEYATYRGDSRALDGNDWNIINRSRYGEPSRLNLFNEVLHQVYPQLVQAIRSVSWYS